MATLSKTKDRNPELFRGSAGNFSTFTEKFPVAQDPEFFTKIDFYEYKRDPAQSNPDRKHTGSLQLPIPTSINDVSNIKVSEVDMGLTATLIEAAVRGARAVSRNENLGDVWNMTKETSQAAWAEMLKGWKYTKSNPIEAGAIMNTLLSGITDGAGAVYGGVIRNPHTTATFNGVSLKSHNFEWKLSPRSEQEATVIENIVKIFKERSHPKISEVTRYALDYPDLCVIEFSGLKNVPRVNFAFIESVSSNINPSGQGFFKDGQPIEVTIGIQLKEIDIRTRETVNE